MSKESVREFVDFVLKYCPQGTKIISTKEVHNTFTKVVLTPEDSDYEAVPYEDVPVA